MSDRAEVTDAGIDRLLAAVRNETDTCRWPLGRCTYPAVIDGLCGYHKGRELRDRDQALQARANATTKPRGSA